MFTPNRKQQQGFTLVELLIVVIILGILAAVVIPQFNSAASESKEAAMASNLATMRQAVEMYKVQHDDNYPGATFVGQLTDSTDIAGVVGNAGYGPYLRNGIPNNPVSLSADVTVVIVDPVAGLGVAGWAYNSVTGQIWSDATGAGPSGTDYFDL